MGLFNKDSSGSSKANHTCPTLSLYETSTSPITGSWSFHQLNVVISGAAVAFSCLSIFVLMANHAMHLSKPKQQLKIMRISIFIPVYGVLCFLSVVAPQTYVYLHPWTDLAEAMALGNFFLLMCELVSPNEDERDTFFAALDVPAKQSRRGRRSGAASSSTPQDGLTWYRKKWIAVFQFIPVSLLIGIFTCITAAANVYCLTSNKPYFAHLWLNIVHNLSLAVSVIAVLSFYKLLKPSLVAHKPLSKLLAFKLLIGLNFLLGIIFTILNGLSNSPLAPTKQLSYSDVTVGIPMLVNCLLMVPFSLFFHYAYDVKEYYLSSSSLSEAAAAAQKLSDGDDQDLESQPMNAAGKGSHVVLGAPPMAYHGGPLGLKAWIQVWNPMEVFRAIAFSFSMASKTTRQTGASNGAGYYNNNNNNSSNNNNNQTYAYDQPPNITELDERYNNNGTNTPPAYGQQSEGRVGGYGGGSLQNPAYSYHQDNSEGYGSNTAYQGAGARY